MDAFVVERLHLRARVTADHIDDLGSYEASLCAGIVNSQAAGEATIGCLEVRTPPLPHAELSHVQVADRMYSHGKRISVGDWVQRGEEVGQVVACVNERGDLTLIVDVASRARACSRRGRLCSLAGCMRSLWRPAGMQVVAAWRPAERGGDVHVMMQ